MKRFMLLFTFTFVCFTLTVNAYAKTIVTDGLVSYWTLDRTNINDRTVEDVWGENDATIVGNPKIADGYLKQGLELGGLRDYVRLPNVGNFGSRIGPYTFEVWFKTSNKKRWSAIYKVAEEPCHRHNNGYGILINAAWGKEDDEIIETREDTIFVQRTNKVGDGGCAGGSSTRHHPISADEWHHIVYTSLTIKPNVNCSESILYIDLEPVGGSNGCSFPNDIRPYTLPIFLGAVNDQGKALGFFQGVFDEVRIYDRALTQEEVIRNYESGIGLGVEPVQKLSTVWGALKAKR